ncbi:hypothetical protein JGU71_18220 [Antrihabitans sp. YC3-6]|uniref:Arsenate reductase n=1 Tax=Antrihabitans stalagmiti TaxID=2799499 RepID=A0A934NST0_9NOCA|nr:hypothetical protein [Antrihabitans stalagmiti]MBJ8340826.1 hypothetical protein [Antrihabitans stalagmiti]
MTIARASDEWVPQACTLPTVDQPLRVAEFDLLFRDAVQRFARPFGTRLSLIISADAEAAARDLADRETRCCSFFTFAFEPAGDVVVMQIGVPHSQVAVLDALEHRVSTLQAARGESETI